MKEQPPVRAAVIDIGSHSVKLLIAEARENKISILETLRSIVPLGYYSFFRGVIPQQTINQVIDIVSRYGRVLTEYAVTDCRVIATTAVREARNRELFADALFRKTGRKLDILTVGDVIYYVDAYLFHTLKGTYPMHEKNLIIAELGSGSLDVSLLEKGLIRATLGLPLGVMRLKQLSDQFDGTREEVSDALADYVDHEISNIRQYAQGLHIDDVVLVDENFTPLVGSMLPNLARDAQLLRFSNENVQALMELCAHTSIQKFQRDYKLSEETAQTVPAYAHVVRSLSALSARPAIYILDISLAEAILANGLLEFELSRKYDKTNQLISAAEFLLERYRADVSHARHVSGLAETLFKALREHMGLKREHLLYLQLAAHLHDIGAFVHNRSHHKHSEYILSVLDLFRLSAEEMRMVACIARYHRKSGPLPSHRLYATLPAETGLIVQKLASLLRIADALDRSHKQKVIKVSIDITPTQDVHLTVYVRGTFLIEKAGFAEKKSLFEEITGSKLTVGIRPFSEAEPAAQ